MFSFEGNVSFYPVCEMGRAWWMLWCEAQAGSSAIYCLLLWFLPVLPANLLSCILSPQLIGAGMQELLRESGIKYLTCLLLNSLLHINTFVSLSLLQFGAKSPWLQWEYIEI